MHTATWPPPHQNDGLNIIVLSVRIHSEVYDYNGTLKIHWVLASLSQRTPCMEGLRGGKKG